MKLMGRMLKRTGTEVKLLTTPAAVFGFDGRTSYVN